ncbi:MAG: TonB-dependent receptor [Bacteroidota bacterium]
MRPDLTPEAGFFVVPVRRTLALFLLLALPVSGAAQEAVRDSLLRDSLDVVTVTATRAPTAAAEAPGRVTVLTRTDVAATGSASVADLLDARSGAFLRRYGPGGLASISLRGTGASQTLILLDGHRIADPQLGQLDLSLLPAVLFEQVEVAHGPGSALHGTDGLGGVINLRTGTSGRQVRTYGEAGAWGARTAGLLVRDEVALPATTLGGAVGSNARFGVLAVADVTAQQGDYAYFDPTRFNNDTGASGLWLRREDTDEQRRNLLARLHLDTERTRSSLGVWHSDSERGLFAFGGTRGERQWDTHLRVWADHARRFGTTELRVGTLVQEGRLRFLGGGVDDTGATRTLSANASLQHPFVVRLPVEGVWTVTAGSQATFGQASHPQLREDAADRSLAAYLSAVGDYGRVRLFPALRYDAVRAADADSSATLTALSPALGLNVQPLARVPLFLKASARRAFRAPTFNDRFWGSVGDPALRPERGASLDAGAALALRRPIARDAALHLDAEASWFASRIRDQIAWRPGSDFVWRPGNVGQVVTRGWELSGMVRYARAGRTVEARGLVTLTKARDRSDPESSSYDQPLLYVPDTQVKAGLGGGTDLLYVDVDVRHTGRRYHTSDGSQSLAPLTVLDVQARSRVVLSQHVAATLALRLDNAADLRYAIVRRFPMPPRHLTLRLALDIR